VLSVVQQLRAKLLTQPTPKSRVPVIPSQTICPLRLVLSHKLVPLSTSSSVGVLRLMFCNSMFLHSAAGEHFKLPTTQPFFTTARSTNVYELYIRDVDSRRIFCTFLLFYIEIALVQDNRLIRILNSQILESDILDVAVSLILSGPSL
jgi:hypothetical protein